MILSIFRFLPLLAIVFIVGCSDTYELHRREWSGLIKLEYKRTLKNNNQYFYEITNNTKYKIESIQIQWEIRDSESGKHIITRECECYAGVQKGGEYSSYKKTDILPYSIYKHSYCYPIMPQRLDNQMLGEMEISKVIFKK